MDLKHKEQIISTRDLILIGKRANDFYFKMETSDKFFHCTNRELTSIERKDVLSIVKDFSKEELSRFGIQFLRSNGHA